MAGEGRGEQGGGSGSLLPAASPVRRFEAGEARMCDEQHVLVCCLRVEEHFMIFRVSCSPRPLIVLVVAPGASCRNTVLVLRCVAYQSMKHSWTAILCLLYALKQFRRTCTCRSTIVGMERNAWSSRKNSDTACFAIIIVLQTIDWWTGHLR